MGCDGERKEGSPASVGYPGAGVGRVKLNAGEFVNSGVINIPACVGSADAERTCGNLPG